MPFFSLIVVISSFEANTKCLLFGKKVKKYSNFILKTVCYALQTGFGTSLDFQSIRCVHDKNLSNPVKAFGCPWVTWNTPPQSTGAYSMKSWVIHTLLAQSAVSVVRFSCGIAHQECMLEIAICFWFLLIASTEFDKSIN